MPTPNFIQVELFTDTDGMAQFREAAIALSEGTAAAALSPLMSTSKMQLRESPVGFRSDWHCTLTPQWVFILEGHMQIGLRDGSTRLFAPGQHFLSNDTVPEGQSFDPARHGHWSRQVGEKPLKTLFVRTA
jgi:hypothetical protein